MYLKRRKTAKYLVFAGSLRYHLLKNTFFIVLCICLCISISGQIRETKSMQIYLFPGQGSDARIFKNLQLDSSYELVYINYPVPVKGSSMKDYALALAGQIDTTKPFVLVGVSLGGMICTELCGIIHPVQTIIISSARKRSDLPGRYTFMKYVPIYKLVPARLIKMGAFIAQPIVEPDRRYDKKTFISMLKGKDPKFLKRTTGMIINWEQSGTQGNIVHIHGTSDHTIPLRNVHSDIIINKGSHMMTYTRADEISSLINDMLCQLN